MVFRLLKILCGGGRNQEQFFSQKDVILTSGNKHTKYFGLKGLPASLFYTGSNKNALALASKPGHFY